MIVMRKLAIQEEKTEGVGLTVGIFLGFMVEPMIEEKD
jgi:hypothetical protein